MKLTGKFKKQAEKTESKGEKKSLTENTGRLLTDDELDKVAGGQDAEIMYVYECSEKMGGCGLTFCSIIPGTPCPECKTTIYLIDLSTL